MLGRKLTLEQVYIKKPLLYEDVTAKMISQLLSKLAENNKNALTVS